MHLHHFELPECKDFGFTENLKCEATSVDDPSRYIRDSSNEKHAIRTEVEVSEILKRESRIVDKKRARMQRLAARRPQDAADYEVMGDLGAMAAEIDVNNSKYFGQYFQERVQP